jgi:mannose-6-phosphate isomerase class I
MPRVPPDQALPLVPSIRHYDWGDRTFIPETQGLPPDGRPWAEAWFGAHPLAPARVLLDGEEHPLDRLVAERPEEILGRHVRDRGSGFPYLLKILAAGRPLSIQVHPDREQAAAGFAREEEAGIPRDAPHRCYRDPHPKPEVLVALTTFHALCGFRSHDEIARVLAALPVICGR